jgi:hypothetical protein
MVEPAAKIRIAPQARQDAAFDERRQSPRYRLRDVRGSLSWQAADGPFSGDVTVLNISGGGAAVLAEQAPGAGQAVRLHLDCESGRFEPIEAVALAASPDESGKTVVRLRFDHWVALDAILEKHRERRLWERYPARESRATLTWHDGPTERTLHGDLLNISGGGAAFVAEVEPPPGMRMWLELEAGARRVPRVDPVESQLVATSADPSGLTIAHLQFVDPCPMEVFELAVNGGEWGLGGRIPTDRRVLAGDRVDAVKDLTTLCPDRMITDAPGAGGRASRPATAGEQGIRCESGTVPPL